MKPIIKNMLKMSDELDGESSGSSLLFLKMLLGTDFFVTVLGVILCLLLRENIERWISMLFIFYILSVISVMLLKRGLYRVASLIYFASIIIIIFTLAWTAGGIRAAAIIHLPIIVMSVGLVLGWRQSFVSGVVVSLGVLGLVLAEFMNLLPPSRVKPSSLVLWANYVVMIAIFSLLQYLSISRLNRALGKTRDELDRRIRAEEEYRRSESRLQSISNNLTEGMIYQILVTPDGSRQFTYVSDWYGICTG